ncbi:MAG TPA: toll/interleukin-1 receptor domain-containing protein [Longimicrobiaceae bacterium]|nr:toll/interleukin-1 receptor domain-containing protein [Longimicrobiaceae bacterium]
MKVFISHSGPRSRAVAAALNEWLRRVIQAVHPFYSPDIEKGAKWSGEVDQALGGTDFGILCLTRDNLRSEWIHYEAGALSKTADALIWTFLLDVEPGEVGQPLGKYQHTIAEKQDVRKLVQAINNRLVEPLPDGVLNDAFDQNWLRLEQGLEAARAIPVQLNADVVTRAATSERDARAMFGEILELLRAQERRTVAQDAWEGKSLLDQINEKRKNTPLLRRIVVHWTESAELFSTFRDCLTTLFREVKNIIPGMPIDGLDGRILAYVEFDPPVYPSRADKIVSDAAIVTGVSQPEWVIPSIGS